MRIPTQEIIFTVLSDMEMILTHLLTALFLGKLCNVLLGEKKVEGSQKRRLWLVPCSYFIVMTVLHFIPVILESITAYLLGSLSAFLAMMLVCRGDIYWKLFLAVTFFSLRWQGTSIVNRICITAFDWNAIFLNWLTKGGFATVWQWNMVHISINMALNLLLNGFMFFLLAKWFTAKFNWKNRRLSHKEMLFLLTPGLFGSVSYLVIRWFVVKYEMVGTNDIFQEYPYFEGMVMCLNGMALLSILVVISLFAELEQKKEEETKQAVLQSQMQELQSHIREMERVYSGIQGMKHDIKNHITVLEELIARKRFQEARDYLVPINQTVESLDYVYKTGNPVTDVIIQEKYKRALELGIAFESTFNFPSQSVINVFDVSIILNNALENALEAARNEQKGYIRISSVLRRQTFLIEIVNSFQGKLEFEEYSGLPQTIKTESGCHGIGLKNICKVAEKYCGAVDIEIQNQEFILTVMMQGMNSKTAITENFFRD